MYTHFFITDRRKKLQREEILALIDEGKSNEEILALFPHDVEVVHSLLQVVTLLEDARDSITPRKNAFRTLLDALPEPHEVTHEDTADHAGGSLLKRLMENIQTTRRVYAPLAGVATLVLIGLFWLRADDSRSDSLLRVRKNFSTPDGTAESVLVPTTDSIGDTAVRHILPDSDGRQETFPTGETGSELDRALSLSLAAAQSSTFFAEDDFSFIAESPDGLRDDPLE